MLLALLFACAPHHQPPVALSTPEERLHAFLRVRASTDPQEEVVFHWQGRIYAQVQPGVRPPSPLLAFEGYNIARAVPDEDGWTVLTREITLYRDPDSGELLDCWSNPLRDGAVVSVAHMANDPVNFSLGAPPVRWLGHTLAWSVEIPLEYPSPLPVDQWPLHSADDTYQSLEAFSFFADSADLADPSLSTVPAHLTWSRVGPWLPWMEMGQAPGRLVYQATGHKLPGGYTDLPEELRAWVSEHAPGFEHAPTEVSGPNQTSWTTFRDHSPSPCSR